MTGKKTEQAAVYSVIFSLDRQSVLLVERRDLPVWVLPGGGLDPGERPEEGAVREAEEETGYVVKVSRQIAEYLPVNRLTQKTYFFECVVTGGEAKTGPEAKTVRYFPLSALPSRLAPPFRGWIEDARQEGSEVIVKKIEGVSYFVLVKLLCSHPILVVRYFLTKIGIRFNDPR